MADAMRVALEIGPKGKRVVGVASDCPGLSRGAKTEDDAVERLRSYLPRYAPVAKLAGMDAAFARLSEVDVVERYPGTGSTDFWGISFASSEIDRQTLSMVEQAAVMASSGSVSILARARSRSLPTVSKLIVSAIPDSCSTTGVA